MFMDAMAMTMIMKTTAIAMIIKQAYDKCKLRTVKKVLVVCLRTKFKRIIFRD